MHRDKELGFGRWHEPEQKQKQAKTKHEIPAITTAATAITASSAVSSGQVELGNRDSLQTGNNIESTPAKDADAQPQRIQESKHTRR